MATQVEINYDRRDKEVKIYANDEKVTGLVYLKGKSISEWFQPVASGRTQWKGFPLELKGILGTDELAFQFISDTESKKTFYTCMEEHGIQLDSTPNMQNTENTDILTTTTTDNSAEKYYETGVSYKEKNPEEAKKYFAMSAELGHSLAQYELGLCFYEGFGTEQDLTQGLSFFEKAANQRNAEAQFSLGVCYLFGRGVNQDMETAFEWLKNAAEQGNSSGQRFVGDCYQNGNGVSEDTEKAVEWFEKAALQNDVEAQIKLGICYDIGNGLSEDKEKAFEWFEKAAGQGHAEGQGRLGFLYYIGEGVCEDKVKAFELFEKSALQDDDISQYMLGLCYKNGDGVSEDIEKAFEWFEKSALLGNADAQLQLSFFYHKGIVVSEDKEKAFEWVEKSALQYNSDAQFSLGFCYDEGKGVKKNSKKAFEWFKKSALQEDSDGQFELGICYVKGKGVEENLKLGHGWIDKARCQGNEEALLYFSEDNAILWGTWLQEYCAAIIQEGDILESDFQSDSIEEMKSIGYQLFLDYVKVAFGNDKSRKEEYLKNESFSKTEEWGKIRKTLATPDDYEESELIELEESLIAIEKLYLQYGQDAFLGDKEAQFQIALFHDQNTFFQDSGMESFVTLAEEGYAPAEFLVGMNMYEKYNNTDKTTADRVVGGGLLAAALAIPVVNAITVPAALGIMGAKKAKDYLDKDFLQKKALEYLQNSAIQGYQPAIDKCEELEITF